MLKRNLYEERITIWSARNFDSAIKKAEKEAFQYAKKTESEYLKFAQCFHLYDEVNANGQEVFSLMREHNYSSEKYLDRYFESSCQN